MASELNGELDTECRKRISFRPCVNSKRLERRVLPGIGSINLTYILRNLREMTESLFRRNV